MQSTVSAFQSVAVDCKRLTTDTLHTNKYRPVPVASCEVGQDWSADSMLCVLRSDSLADVLAMIKRYGTDYSFRIVDRNGTLSLYIGVK